MPLNNSLFLGISRIGISFTMLLVYLPITSVNFFSVKRSRQTSYTSKKSKTKYYCFSHILRIPAITCSGILLHSLH